MSLGRTKSVGQIVWPGMKTYQFQHKPGYFRFLTCILGKPIKVIIHSSLIQRNDTIIALWSSRYLIHRISLYRICVCINWFIRWMCTIIMFVWWQFVAIWIIWLKFFLNDGRYRRYPSLLPLKKEEQKLIKELCLLWPFDCLCNVCIELVWVLHMMLRDLKGYYIKTVLTFPYQWATNGHYFHVQLFCLGGYCFLCAIFNYNQQMYNTFCA